MHLGVIFLCCSACASVGCVCGGTDSVVGNADMLDLPKNHRRGKKNGHRQGGGGKNEEQESRDGMGSMVWRCLLSCRMLQLRSADV